MKPHWNNPVITHHPNLNLKAADTDKVILEHQRAARQKTLKEMGKEKEHTRAPKRSSKKLNPRLVQVVSITTTVRHLLDPYTPMLVYLEHVCHSYS